MQNIHTFHDNPHKVKKCYRLTRPWAPIVTVFLSFEHTFPSQNNNIHAFTETLIVIQFAPVLPHVNVYIPTFIVGVWKKQSSAFEH